MARSTPPAGARALADRTLVEAEQLAVFLDAQRATLRSTLGV